MIPKILTALISAIILSAVLGALPCEATGLKHNPKAKAASQQSSPSPRHDFNNPSMDFSGAKPIIDNPRPEVIAPKRDKDQFFD